MALYRQWTRLLYSSQQKTDVNESNEEKKIDSNSDREEDQEEIRGGLYN